MDAILQFLIDWGYWGLFLGSFTPVGFPTLSGFKAPIL